MAVSPRASAASETSIRVTLHPCCANTWAMPLPIVPAPTTEGGIAERAGMSTRAAIVVWAEAVRATPNAAPETIAATLATRTFQFRGADLRFDADGNGSRPIYKPQRWTPAGRADMP